MTQEFKFGDLVRHPDFKTECVFIRQYYDSKTGEKTWAEVFNDEECETQTRLVTHEPLELVPHPDTVRLDWIIKNGACIYDEDGKWTLDIDDDSPDCGDADAIRETIDCIMQQTHKRP